MSGEWRPNPLQQWVLEQAARDPRGVVRGHETVKATDGRIIVSSRSIDPLVRHGLLWPGEGAGTYVPRKLAR